MIRTSTGVGLVLFLFAAATPAHAATVNLAVTGTGDDRQARVSYRALPGEQNNVEVFLDWSRDNVSLRPWPPRRAQAPAAFVINDAAREIPGAGCERMFAPNNRYVRCAIPGDASPLGPQVALGDGDDIGCIALRLPGTRVAAGRGNDDILYVSKTQNNKVNRRNCERVLHKSAKDAVNDRNGLYD